MQVPASQIGVFANFQTKHVKTCPWALGHCDGVFKARFTIPGIKF